jgi:hypothetical protein
MLDPGLPVEPPDEPPDEPPVVLLSLAPDEPPVPDPLLPDEPPMPEPVLPAPEAPLLPEPLPVVASLLFVELPDEPDVPEPPEPEDPLMPEALLPDEPLEPALPPALPPAPEPPLLWAKAEPASIADTNNAIDNLFILCSLIGCQLQDAACTG